eukprot:PhF_6_TR14093/c0_g1_i2/m.22519
MVNDSPHDHIHPHRIITKNSNNNSDFIRQAALHAVHGGIAGYIAQTVNVISFMWLHTVMNYQYRNGGQLVTTTKLLYREGGIPRFYRGIVPALIYSPISRFGDVAANDGILTLFQSQQSLQNVPVFAQTATASCTAAVIRLLWMPLDAWKTTKQVEGAHGLQLLREKVVKHGVGQL